MQTLGLGLLLLLLSAGTSLANWEDTPVTTYQLSEPPRRGSSEEHSELQALHRREQERTPEYCAQGRKQTAHDFQTLFGDRLSSREERKLKTFMTKVFAYADTVASHFKEKHRRARPYSVDTSLQPCISKPSGATSYPSGHSTLGTVGGCVLAELIPTRAREMEEHGHWVGELRLWGGVHFPSDVEAGRTLGSQICARLLSQKDFVRELERVRDQL